MKSRLLLAISGVVACTVATACLWDRDTLAEEVREGSRDVLSIIVGRFERNPPLYYQMRLERVRKELGRDPRNLALYDDAAVASDRLGKHDDAIDFMGKKQLVMERIKPSDDDRYRYHANLGTFYAHRGVKGVQKPGANEDLKAAIHHLNRALQINPNAHFGRERYQLAILEWLTSNATLRPDDRLALGAYLNGRRLMEYQDLHKTIEGLTGLIRLGNAWESPDVFGALANALSGDAKASVAVAARERFKELEAAGKKSLVGTKDDYLVNEFIPEEGIENQAISEYKRLRQESDRWHDARTSYMMTRLKQGRHPDTDPTFWTGFREPAMEIKDPPPWIKESFQFGLVLAAVLGLGIAAVVGIIFVALRIFKPRQALP